MREGCACGWARGRISNNRDESRLFLTVHSHVHPTHAPPDPRPRITHIRYTFSQSHFFRFRAGRSNRSESSGTLGERVEALVLWETRWERLRSIHWGNSRRPRGRLASKTSGMGRGYRDAIRTPCAQRNRVDRLLSHLALGAPHQTGPSNSNGLANGSRKRVFSEIQAQV